MKTNILIISYAYPPNNAAGAQRPYAMAKYLDKTKYNVTVLTCENPSTPLGINRDFDPSLEGVKLIKIKSFLGSSSDGLRVKSGEKKNSIKRILFSLAQWLVFPDKAMFWYPNIKSFLKKNKQLMEKTDIVISTAPGVTNHKIARYIKRKNNHIQWLADFRDFYYTNHWEEKLGLKPLLHKILERSIVKEASTLSFVTQTMKNAYQQAYPKFRNKMHSVYNGFDLDTVSDLSSIKSGKITFFYAGTFYNGIRSPLPLLQLLDRAFELNDLKPDEVVIQIAGNIDDPMKQQMTKFLSFQCIEFLGLIPKNQVLKYMKESTFLWLIVGNIKAHYQTVPIKLFEYIATKKPIVNFAPSISESTQIIQSNQLGYNFNTLDFELSSAYLEFKKLIADAKNKDFDAIYQNRKSIFTWENQIKKIELLFT